MNKKTKPKKEVEVTKQGEVPQFKSPTKTIWGRVIIIVIVLAMLFIPLIALIVQLFQ